MIKNQVPFRFCKKVGGSRCGKAALLKGTTWSSTGHFATTILILLSADFDRFLPVAQNRFSERKFEGKVLPVGENRFSEG